MGTALVSFLVGFVFSVLCMPIIIKSAKKLKAGQPILGYVENHSGKSGTPTMGGIIFILTAFVVYLAFYSNNNSLALISLACLLGYGILGFLDDFIKVKYKDNQGLRAYQKIIGQVGIAILMGLYVYLQNYVGGQIIIPFTDVVLDLGYFIIPIVIFVFLATTNAVNLTDGLDGLAGGVSFIVLGAFLIVLNIYVLNLEAAGQNPAYIAELKNLLNLVGGVLGCVLGFLCFNMHPAKIFMGDTGSLALGGFLACIFSVTKFYLLLPVLGVMFVVSALSVIIQVLYFKKTKKRIFLMAPLHHHFEKKGCYETKIVTIYIVISFVIAIVCILLAGV